MEINKLIKELDLNGMEFNSNQRAYLTSLSSDISNGEINIKNIKTRLEKRRVLLSLK